MKYDIINANTYEDLADFLIIPAENKLFTSDFLRKDGIIMAKTDYIDYLFENLKFSGRNYVLITGHSDYPIDEFRFKKKPSCIKKWFSNNVQYNHLDLIPIPVGLYVHRGFTKNVFFKFDIDWFDENVERLHNNEKILDTVHCSWNSTNANRNKILDDLTNLGIKYHWVSGKSYEEYCETMSHYKFVISPPGNAPDCFRTWEAMHFGCIPVVIKTRLTKECSELPMIQLNNYNELSNELMQSYLNKTFNMEKLYMKYWKNKIINAFNKIKK